MKIEKFEKC